MGNGFSEHAILHKVRMSITQALSKEMLSDAKYDVYLDNFSRMIVTRLSKDIWAEKLQNETKELLVPDTWWDHLKQDLPQWMRRLLKPIQYREIKVTFERNAVFPTFRYDTDGKELPFVYMEGITLEDIAPEMGDI